MNTAHQHAILEAWISEHRGITVVDPAMIFERHVARAFTLPNASRIIIMTSGYWQHYSHYAGLVVRGDLGLETLIPYLDSLHMPRVPQ